MNQKLLKQKLDAVVRRFHSTEFLKTDPIQFPHRYRNAEDIELVALIAALFSFGNVKSIFKVLESVLSPLDPQPAHRLRSLSVRQIRQMTKPLYYRFFSSSDIASLLISLQKLHHQNSRPLHHIVSTSPSRDVLSVLNSIRSQILSAMPEPRSSAGIKFMLPDPHAGAAKRLHMFLRWMVRHDAVDFGLWRGLLPAEDLFIPLDVHLFEICRALGLTTLKSPSLNAVREVSKNLKRLNPLDPIGYDFALCRLGILGLKAEAIKSLISAPVCPPPDAPHQKALD